MVQACEIHGFINRVTNTDQPTQGQGEFGSQWGWQNFMKSVLCAKSEMLWLNLNPGLCNLQELLSLGGHGNGAENGGGSLVADKGSKATFSHCFASPSYT